MNGEELLTKISNIDDDLIEAADQAKSKKNKIKFKKWAALASCVCLVVLGILMMKPNFEDTPKQVESNGTNVPSGITDNNDILVPKINLPESDGTISADMIGLIVYKGSIYTQGESYEGQEVASLETMVGKKLGYAMGNIDEWSQKSEYDTEFAATVEGNVYEVVGYSPDFRICIKESYTTEDGKSIEYISFYEKLNGIELAKGKDLFEDRLQLLGNWEKVKYVTHDNWDNSSRRDYVYKDLTNVSKEDIDYFIQELSTSQFVDMLGSDIYNNPNHHIYFYLKDNTRVELRLFEGGYVGYQPLGWYFVKMPGEIFEKIYSGSK